ncbi:MAG: hypothetical protein PHX20_04385 [Candidatus Omnitrophica bacterium]|nr:hypothetical protein [Candidatus Omnitrophota bacterium]MDD5436763.1 hypothetical protein [Candidatus Omnitrophota bacterium]
MDNRIIDFCILLGSLLLFFIFSILLVSAILFIFGFTISPVSLFAGISASVLLAWWGIRLYYKTHRARTLCALILLVAVIILGSVCLSGRFYDVWCDSQVFHQEAVIRLANGWNPFYTQLPSSLNIADKWLNPYSKGPWICAAVLYKVTGRIEQSKAFNLLFMLASFFLSFAALLSLRRIKPPLALLTAFLFSFNPVSICQVMSFYVDGQMASLIISLIALLFLSYTRNDRMTPVIIIAAVCLMINVKLSGLVYFLVITAGFMPFLFLNKDPGMRFKMCKVFFASFIIGALLVGFNPYVTSSAKYGHPFYSVLDPIDGQMPKNFSSMNRFEKLAFSIFSRSENIKTPMNTSLKWPFTFSAYELVPFAGPDTRIGGFGPLFGGALILASLIMLASFKLDPKKTCLAAGASVFFLLFALVNPEAWWARYAPQLWLIPFISLILAVFIRGKLVYYLYNVLLAVLLVNVLLVTYSYMDAQVEFSGAVKEQLRFISANSGSAEVLVKFNDFKSTRVRLSEAGIKYREIERTPPVRSLNLFSVGGVATQVYFKKPIGDGGNER